MYSSLLILEFISSLNFTFSEDDSFAVTPKWIHSTNIDFLKQLQKQFPGDIKSCEPEGDGYYLIFKSSKSALL